VRRGGLYIYRVLAPERATLAIARNRAGAWRVSELKAAANHPPANSTVAAIRTWLAGGTYSQLWLFPDLPF
jgi:hypothetical protein